MGESLKAAADPSVAAGGVPPPQNGQAPRRMLNNRFVLEEQLGFGGMGTVYRALDLRRVEAEDRDPHVAVKILSLQFQAHPNSFIALQREAKKAQSLAHPNIVTVYDFDRDESTVYMTMEYLPGKSLRDRITAAGSAGMPAQEALPLIEGMAKALIYAHQKGIVHCDFKPGNVLANERGDVKVIDFGIARAFKQIEGDTDLEATRFDAGSLRALTPTYASPEMLEDREPDPRDDIYALGCIAYEMVAGHHPFGGLTSIEARYKGLVPKRVPGLTGKQWRALRSTLALEREQRTPSVAQFIQQFRPSERRVPWLPIVGVLLAVVLGSGVYHFNSRWLSPSTETRITAPSVMGKAGETASREDRRLRFPLPEKAGQQTGKTDEGTNGAETPPDTPVAPSRADVAPPLASPSVYEVSPAALNRLIEQTPCSALVADANEGVVNVHGFLASPFGGEPLEGRVRSLPGVRHVSADVQSLNADKCQLVDLYAPFWIRNKRFNLGASIGSAQPSNTFAEGESLVFRITTPGYPAYVNVDYFTLDGAAIHLVPSPDVNDNLAPANYRATLGDLGEWRIGPPFGNDLLALLLTPEPLFDLPRPPTEGIGEYLEATAKRLKQMEAKHDAARFAADMLLITTRPRSNATPTAGTR